jgi:pyrimidine-nucleoside phosphorylase
MLTPARLIEKKRDKKELSNAEIRDFIKGLGTGEVADYQATAWLMAIYLNGMTLKETVALTEAMLESGERYSLKHIAGAKVDKHSTGGVGDKVSLILAPLAAACGLKVPMMSGRGLGHTGGTLDKLESISGFNVRLNKAQFEDVLARIGCVMIGQTDTIAPADKKLYALRDVTGTVECIPLIVASILSKKLAEGCDGLILDVKVGNGAFMKSKAQAKTLARTLVLVARQMGLKCRALLTSMDQPLGYAVGNSLEMLESIEILKGDALEKPFLDADLYSCDLKELTLQLCAQMLEIGKVVPNLNAGRKLASEKLADGSAYRKFLDLVKAQGGSLEQAENPLKLPLAPQVVQWKTKRRGYVSGFHTDAIGQLLIELGGGRRRASDPVDPSVGFVLHKKIGSRVAPGDPLVTVYASANTNLAEIEKAFHASVEITANRKAAPQLLVDSVTK